MVEDARIREHPVADIVDEAHALARLQERMFGTSSAPPCIGHYELKRPIGSGGGGTVYLAHDPKLRRQVAIKLLKPRADAGRSSKRLLREAHLLARISHPNVVSVFDVGTLDEHVYLVMEFVDGPTLGEWVATEKPSTRALLEIYRAIGEGVAAVHREGLTHRDFKPSNVLVDRSGRPKVVDFGLARVSTSPHTTVETSGTMQPTTPDVEDGSMSSTDGGAIVGTPAYMAPEQFAGHPADAASDQFAFCVAFYESLYGRRPFAGDCIEALAEAVAKGPRILQKRGANARRVPRWLRRVLARGLAPDGEQRWPSMDRLLYELASGQARARRASVSAAAALFIAVPGALMLAQKQHAAQQCREDASALDAHWGDTRAEEIRAVFEGTELVYAAETWERVEPRLHAYHRSWRDAFERACLAVRVEGERSEAEFAQSLHCFEERKAAFAGLIELFAEGSSATIRHAASATFALPDVTQCNDEEWLRLRPVPDDPALAARVSEIRRELLRSILLQKADEQTAAWELATSLHARALELNWDPLLAELEYQLGALHDSRGEFELATAKLESAYRRAGAVGLDRTAADAAVHLSIVAGERLGKRDQALVWATSAEMLLDRIGDHGQRRGTLAFALALAHRRAGESEKALFFAERGRDAVNRAPDATDIGRVSAASNVAGMNVLFGDPERAGPLLHEALELQTRVLGPHHPSTANTLYNLAQFHISQDDYAQALDCATRALTAVRGLGEKHPRVLRIRSTLALGHMGLAQFDEARSLARRVLDAQREVLGDNHPDIRISLNTLGLIAFLSGRYEEARAIFQEFLTHCLEADTQSPYEQASALHNIGAAALELGDYRSAVMTLSEALELRSGVLDPEHEEVLAVRGELAFALIRLGKIDQAGKIVEPLLEVQRRVLGHRSVDVARTLHALALLSAERRELARAVELLTEAESIYLEVDASSHGRPEALHDLGEVYRRQGQLSLARSAFARALELRTKRFGPDHPSTRASETALNALRE